jgi:hypothetical protein
LVLDSVSSAITKRVYNLGLDEFFAWYELEPRPGFTKAAVSAWRVALEARAGWVAALENVAHILSAGSGGTWACTASGGLVWPPARASDLRPVV